MGVLRQWCAAFAAADADALAALHAEDALFIGTGEGEVAKGRAAIRGYFARVLPPNRPCSAAMPQPSTLSLSAETVVITGVDEVGGVRDGVAFSRPGRATFVIARRGETWQIVHFHRSAMPQ